MSNLSITQKFFPFLFIAVISSACAGDSDDKEEVNIDSCYAQDHEWIVAAAGLKTKLGLFQQDFTAIANMELEETVCPEGTLVPLNGNKSELHLWLMMNYMLDNFDPEKFGQYNFGMPADKMKREIPITALDWLNFTSDPANPDFSLYSDYPDLKNIPTDKADSSGAMKPYDKPLQDASTLLTTLSEGLFAVVAVVDYLPPSFVSETEFETGYVMGYLLLGDWETGKLTCMMPLLAENSTEIDFTNYDGEIQDDEKIIGLLAMDKDLKLQTFESIKAIVRKMTGFSGTISVNN